MLFKFNVDPRFAISRQLSNLLELSCTFSLCGCKEATSMIIVQADAKSKVSVGAGKVVGGTNAAAGIYANINYKRAPHQCCYHISDLQSSSMRFLKDKHQPLYQH